MMWASMAGWLSSNGSNLRTAAISLAISACCVGGYLLMDKIKKDSSEEFIVMKRNAKGQFQRADKNAYSFEKQNPAEVIAAKKQQEAAASSTKFPSIEENAAEPDVKPETEIRKSPLQSEGMPEKIIRRSPLQSDSKTEIKTEKETVNNPVFIPTPVFLGGANGANGQNGMNGRNGRDAQYADKDAEGMPERVIRHSSPAAESRNSFSSVNSYSSSSSSRNDQFAADPANDGAAKANGNGNGASGFGGGFAGGNGGNAGSFVGGFAGRGGQYGDYDEFDARNGRKPGDFDRFGSRSSRDDDGLIDRLERLEKLQRHSSGDCSYGRVPSAADYVSSARGCSRCSIMTNADRIRSMTDEELAEFLADVERGGLKPVRFLRLWLKQEERK